MKFGSQFSLSLFSVMSYLPFCSSFVRAGSCLAVCKLIVLAFWLCDPLLSSHIYQACLRVFSHPLRWDVLDIGSSFISGSVTGLAKPLKAAGNNIINET